LQSCGETFSIKARKEMMGEHLPWEGAVPPWVTDLRELLKHANQIIERESGDAFDKLGQEFEACMEPFGLTVGKVRTVRHGFGGAWVIEPQLYNSVTKLTKDSEAIREDYFSLDDYASESETVTTGGGRDPWFRAKPEMLPCLKRFIASSSTPKKKLMRLRTEVATLETTIAKLQQQLQDKKKVLLFLQSRAAKNS
jgi:hypothetical protein